MHNEDELIFAKTPARNRANKFSFTDDQIKAYNGLIKFINEPYNPNDFKRALIGAGGTGKALANNTPVLTDNGWKNIGDIKVGDFVATPYHAFSKVIGVYPQGVKSIVYKITFADGRNIICDENHLWLVRTKKQLANYRYYKNRGGNTRYSKVLTTKELLSISLTTTAFAPILTLLPIFAFPIIFAPAPI